MEIFSFVVFVPSIFATIIFFFWSHKQDNRDQDVEYLLLVIVIVYKLIRFNSFKDLMGMVIGSSFDPLDQNGFLLPTSLEIEMKK
jgi:hypothetical protein